jgi:uncharacterized protein RhaS with RHS repeats
MHGQIDERSAHMYDPTIGRWLSEDPVGFAVGDTNLYRYVGNAPTMYIDPTGLDWLDSAANWAAGWGDTLSFGTTDRFRNWAGINGGIDHNGTAYHVGQWTGVAHQVAIVGAVAAEATAAGTLQVGVGRLGAVRSHMGYRVTARYAAQAFHAAEDTKTGILTIRNLRAVTWAAYWKVTPEIPIWFPAAAASLNTPWSNRFPCALSVFQAFIAGWTGWTPGQR